MCVREMRLRRGRDKNGVMQRSIWRERGEHQTAQHTNDRENIPPKTKKVFRKEWAPDRFQLGHSRVLLPRAKHNKMPQMADECVQPRRWVGGSEARRNKNLKFLSRPKMLAKTLKR